MPNDNINRFQRLVTHLAMPALLLGILSACADEIEAERQINSPGSGLVQLGDQVRTEGDDQGAMEFYARAAQREPDNRDAHEKLAALLEKHGDEKDAADQYRILTTLNAGNIDYYRNYGRALIKLNQYAEAKTQYQAALTIDSSDTKALNGLGIALDLLGDHAGAQEQYKASLQQKPDDPVTLNNLGHSYILSGSYDAAISLLEPEYNNPAMPAPVHENLAEAYGMDGMYLDAERVLKKDFTSDQIKKKLAHYRSLRAKTKGAAVYANLGSFATADLANAHRDKIKQQFPSEAASLSIDIMPEVDEEGGTPIFVVRANGFASVTVAHSFCEKLKKGAAFCKEHEG